MLTSKVRQKMGRIKSERRWRCKSCAAVSFAHDLMTAKSPFEGFALTACPECKCCDVGLALMCDETDCTQEASSGWPTGDSADAWGGYRQTCYQHREVTNVEIRGGEAVPLD